MKTSERIPSLDGIRALALSIVIVGHLSVREVSTSTHVSIFWRMIGHGGAGVDIFFVLSGYLITTLLIREFEKNGRIDLKRFYWRRAFRILPAFYLYIAVIILLSLVMGWAVPWGKMAQSALFLNDYTPLPEDWRLSHTWSLAVEEQFYIFWPLMLGLLLRRGGKKAAIVMASVLIVAAAAMRILDSHLNPDRFSSRDFMMLHTRVDTLMFGCLFALLSGSLKFEWVYDRLRRIWWVFPLWLFVIGNLLTRVFVIPFRLKWELTLNGFAIAFTTLFLSRSPSHWCARLLNIRWIAFIGAISYGLYLWQPTYVTNESIELYNKFPWLFVALIFAPVASYFFVEKPLLRLRARLVL